MKGDVKEIYKLYDGKYRELHIPVYQRNYDWSIKQCARLFDDLETLHSENYPKHFFGAVVGKSDGTFKWNVIDGQQRLTTVSLLILALTHSIRDKKIEVRDPLLGEKITSDYLLHGETTATQKIFKLKPVDSNATAYEKLFGEAKGFIESSNMTVNYRFFLEQLENTSMTAEEVWDAISRLEVMHLDLESHDDPQRIFETLNSTGMALSEADKIRNLVLMGLGSEDQNWLYKKRWNPIEHHVDFRTDWYIRWYLVTKTTKTPKESDVFESFKTYLKRAKLPVTEVLDDMHTYSHYAYQITHATTGFSKVDRRLKLANLIRGDVTLPFLMSVLHDVHEGVIEEKDLLKLISIMESYIFRRLVAQIPSNALNKIFATAYNELKKLYKPGLKYSDIFIYLLQRRDNTTGRFPDDTEFREAFETRNFYSMHPGVRRYVFDLLENGDSNDTRDIANGLAHGDLSIEHIMPQNLSPAWRNELGKEADDIHATWNNRLANLTITGYNSSYSNSPFHTKKTMEEGFLNSPYRLNNFIKKQQHWGLEELKQRSQILVELALEYWPLPPTTFAPPKAILPTEPMAEETNFTGRAIIAYELGEVRETVANWADFLPKLLRQLASEHREELLRFSADDNSTLRTADAMSDTDIQKFRKVDSGFYVLTHTSTNSKIFFLRKVFSHLGLDPDDLIFTLRPTTTAKNPAPEVEEHPSKYATLIKYLPEFEEVQETTPSVEDTAELREHFLKDFEQFKRSDALQDLGNRSIEEFKAATPLGDTDDKQVLALITQSAMMSQLMGAGFLHNLITSGELVAYLKRLEQF